MPRAALLLVALAACFDSRRIVFTDEGELADAGGANGAGAPARATAAAEPAAATAEADQRSADPGTLQATAAGAEVAAPLDAGVVTPVDAGAPAAAP